VFAWGQVSAASEPAAATTPAKSEAHVGLTTPLVIPIPTVIGGTGVSNNANPNNPKGGYWSHIAGRAIGPADYGNSPDHGDFIGNTSLMNDSTKYWDNLIWPGTGKPGGLAATGVTPPDPGCGDICWLPQPGEWVSYAFNVDDAGTYTVLYRFSSGTGPDGAVMFHMTMDGISSGPVKMQPDNRSYWTDKSHCVGGWWGHTYVPATMPVGWALTPGPHVLKVFIDNWPKTGGSIWLHYFKVLHPAGKIPLAGSAEAEGVLGKGAASTPDAKPVEPAKSVAASVAEPAAPVVKPFPGDKPVRINCGSDFEFTDSAGNLWLTDQCGTGGGIVYRGDRWINNTKDAELYQTEHWGVSNYIIPIANGDYTVKLHFAETWFNEAGKRLFNVSVNGMELKNLDVAAAAGGAGTALVEKFPAKVADGKLTIIFTPVKEGTLINGIEILPGKADVTTPTQVPLPKIINAPAPKVVKVDTTTNLALHKVYLPGSNAPAPEKAFDGDPATNTGGPVRSLAVDLGGNYNILRTVVNFARLIGPNPAYRVKYRMSWSSDGKKWMTAYGVGSPEQIDTQQVEITDIYTGKPASVRYLKWDFSKVFVPDDWIEIANVNEIAVYGTPAPPEAKDANAEVPCELSDASAGFHWAGGGHGISPDKPLVQEAHTIIDEDPYLGIALADSQNRQQAGDYVTVRVKAPNGFNHIKLLGAPKYWAVQTSADGKTWSDNIATGSGNKSNIDIRFPLQSGPKAQYVRVVVTKTLPDWWRVAELMVFGPGK
jgi:hypothetical protein